MAEYQHADGLWTCSSHQQYLPGVYESRRACRIAYRKSDLDLFRLWDGKRGPDGVVPDAVALTEAEVRALPERHLSNENRSRPL